jgi:light-independent protochlorophyllide reductase subunit B
VVPLELPAYQRKENWGAAETFYQVVRALAGTTRVERAPREGRAPRCNLLGPTALGFRHRDDVTEITRLLTQLGVEVNVTAPMDASPDDIARLPQADFNVVLYPETAAQAAQWLQRIHSQPFTKVIPIGIGATREFVAEVAAVPVGTIRSRLFRARRLLQEQLFEYARDLGVTRPSPPDTVDYTPSTRREP